MKKGCPCGQPFHCRAVIRLNLREHTVFRRCGPPSREGSSSRMPAIAAIDNETLDHLLSVAAYLGWLQIAPVLLHFWLPSIRREALAILRGRAGDTKPATTLVFPICHRFTVHQGDSTLNAALRRLGYNKDQMTAHGFTGMASTRLNEMGCWNPDAKLVHRFICCIDQDPSRFVETRAARLPSCWEKRGVASSALQRAVR